MTPAALLAFERAHWCRHDGRKEHAIRETFGCSAAYYTALLRAARSPEGVDADPLTARRCWSRQGGCVVSVHGPVARRPVGAGEALGRSAGGTAAGRSTSCYATKDQAEAEDARRRLQPGEAGGSATVGEAWKAWKVVKAAEVRPSTMETYAKSWRVHVEPRWALVRADRVRDRDMREWAATIASPSARRQSIVVLRQVLASAGVTVTVRAPRQVKAEAVPLDQKAVAAIAAACAPHEAVVWLLACTGVRWGEAAGLRVGDVDRRRRRIRVQRSYGLVDGRATYGPLKRGGARSVPVPAWLLGMLDLSRPATAPLLATSRGLPWRSTSWKRVWAAAKDGCPSVRPWPRVHDLRHAAAARAIEQGMDLRTLQRMLGHASLTMTVDLYGHLAGDRLDAFEGLWDAPGAPDAPPDERPA